MADKKPKLTKAKRQAKRGKKKAIRAIAKGNVPTYATTPGIGDAEKKELPIIKPKPAATAPGVAPARTTAPAMEEDLGAPEGIYRKSGTEQYIKAPGERKIQSIKGTGLAKSVSRMGRLRKHSELQGQKFEREGLTKGKELTLDEMRKLDIAEHAFLKNRRGEIPKWLMGYQEYIGEKGGSVDTGFGMGQYMLSDPDTGKWYLPKIFDPRRAYEGHGVKGEKKPMRRKKTKRVAKREVTSPIQF